MDPITMIMVGLTFVGVIGTMLLDGVHVTVLIQPAALMLIFVGTFGAASAGMTKADLAEIPRGFKRAFLSKAPDASGLVDVIVKMADRARREGLLALEDMAKEIEDPLLKEGIQMTVDGSDADEIAEILEMRVTAKKEQDKVGAAFFEGQGGYAPTLGVVGAVIGLIHALGNLDQVDKLGEMIGAAFVATLWGVLIGNAVWLPMAAKLKRLSALEVKGMEMIIEGVLAVQAGTSPRVVEQKLRSALPSGGKDTGKGKEAKAA
ncbi:motility protein A [Dermatophilus congolensis]|uniref:Chemotaxis protein MotA n=1 Tax=Dermatophilus congolensis TaxID=1863 RepID=A0A239VU23_9MICO|nr:MotA/TolQ/ExbB proton channel family protein [Dermatophilus congolensis]MBO3129987.1 motility protein A [Dermatophilus congolensis]MBO3131383.1 motility protein A [Dermatophilus congolensis]MBO3134461.1 motility protein A [Dermatophilus congolensis]MBO3136696.1 motility protein A [Dermatophilus congolensis]MBO3138941.1 motility protein A [Dermatophilus congolensis]